LFARSPFAATADIFHAAASVGESAYAARLLVDARLAPPAARQRRL